jgi:hypothetical protein
MFDLLWTPIAVTAGGELATSGLPHSPVVADKRRRARRPARRESWRLPRRAARPLRPRVEHGEAV